MAWRPEVLFSTTIAWKASEWLWPLQNSSNFKTESWADPPSHRSHSLNSMVKNHAASQCLDNRKGWTGPYRDILSGCSIAIWYSILWLLSPYEPLKVFGTSSNRRGVPTSFPIPVVPVAFLGAWPCSPTPHLFLIAKCFACDAYLVLGVFLTCFAT